MAKYALVACEVLKQEFSLLKNSAKNEIDIFVMDLGLHASGSDAMSKKLQEFLDGIDQKKYDALLLGYALCSNGTCSLHAEIPLVLPRGHDCITLFMGSKEKYREYFDTHKGTFFATPSGWDTTLTDDLRSRGPDAMYAEFVEKYGEEDAKYLMETLGNPLEKYSRLAFIDNGVADSAETAEKIRKAAAFAAKNNWEFDEVRGNTDILRDLLDGRWDPEVFLVLPPGMRITQSFDDGIVKGVDAGVTAGIPA